MPFMKKVGKRLLSLVHSDRAGSAALTAAVLAAVILLNAIVYAVTVQFGLYLYSPAGDDLTVSGSTDAFFERVNPMDAPVQIIFCRAEDELRADSVGSFVLSTAEQLAARHSFLSLEFVNLITMRDSHGNYFDLSPYREDEEGEEVPLYETSVIFSSSYGHRTVTDFYTGSGYGDFFTLDSSFTALAYNGEETMAAMIAWVLTVEHPAVYFTAYHGETAEIGFRNLLLSAGYRVDTLDLSKNEVPTDASLVIISTPVKDFARGAEGTTVRTELERLESYLDRGGNLYVSLDPYGACLENLEGLLEEHGMQVRRTEREGTLLTELVRDSAGAVTLDGFTLLASAGSGTAADSLFAVVRRLTDRSVILRECAALTLSGGAEPLLLSSPTSSLAAGGSATDASGSYVLAATAEVHGSEGATGRIVCVPSVFLTATDALVSGGYANRDFLYAMLDTAFGADRIPYGCAVVRYDSGVLENLTRGASRSYAVAIFAVPVLLTLVGVAVVIRRKNR